MLYVCAIDGEVKNMKDNIVSSTVLRAEFMIGMSTGNTVYCMQVAESQWNTKSEMILRRNLCQLHIRHAVARQSDASLPVRCPNLHKDKRLGSCCEAQHDLDLQVNLHYWLTQGARGTIVSAQPCVVCAFRWNLWWLATSEKRRFW